MKKIFLIALGGLIMSACVSCKKDDNTNNDDNNNNQIPDIHYEFTVSGDHNQHEEIHIPGGIQSDYTATGSYQSQTDLLNVSFTQVTQGGWVVGLLAETDFFDAGGTYSLTENAICQFEQVAFKATSGNISLTKVDFFVENNGMSQYFVDGTFTGTYEEIEPEEPNPPRVINITGEFSGVPLTSF